MKQKKWKMASILSIRKSWELWRPDDLVVGFSWRLRTDGTPSAKIGPDCDKNLSCAIRYKVSLIVDYAIKKCTLWARVDSYQF